VWKSRVSFWAFSLQTQVSSRLSPSYDYRAHSPVPVPLPSSATLPPPPAPTHLACSLTSSPTRHDPSATAPISLPRSTKHKTHGLDIASYLPRLPRYHNGTCFLRFSSCRQQRWFCTHRSERRVVSASPPGFCGTQPHAVRPCCSSATMSQVTTTIAIQQITSPLSPTTSTRCHHGLSGNRPAAC
jgi:hypothetical protein